MRNSARAWYRTEQARLGVSGPVPISGDTIVIGNPNSPKGSAYVFMLVVDSDGDGVLDDDDVCDGTVIPDPTIPTKRLGTNRWALVDNEGAFDTFHPKGKAPKRSYTIADTGGCNAAQIADALGLGNGHYKHGLSNGAMDE